MIFNNKSAVRFSGLNLPGSHVSGIKTARFRLNFMSSTACLLSFFLGTSASLLVPTLPSVSIIVYLLVASVLFSLMFTRARVVSGFFLGFLWMCFSVQSFLTKTFLDEFEGQDLSLAGTVINLPVTSSGNSRFRLRIDEIAETRLRYLVSSQLQLSCYRCDIGFKAGEKWRFTVRLKRPHGYASWGAFDYEKYLFRHEIVGKGYIRLNAENQKLGEVSWSVNNWRQWIKENISGALESNASSGAIGRSIILALTIGVKTGFSHEQQQVLQVTGVSHLMAISGLHIGLVFLAMSKLFKWVLTPFSSVFNRYPRQQLCLFPALVAAGAYAALAGFSVSTQRALIMLAVFVLCKLLAREVSLAKVLLIAVFLLVLIDPFSILDTGFWLSCSAVAIIALVSSDNKQLSLIRLQPMLWLGMLPLSVMFFAQASLVSPLINLIAVPVFCVLLIPLTLMALVMLLIGLHNLSSWCFTLLCEVYEYVFLALESISRLSIAKVYATPLVWWQWAVFLILLLAFSPIARRFFENNSRYAAGFKMLASLVLITSIIRGTPAQIDSGELNVALLDVGQGLAMVIETQNTVTVYDTGPRYGSGFTAAEAVLLPYLRQRGITVIDTLVISHADNDHIGGMTAVLAAFEVRRLVSSRIDKVQGAEECTQGQQWKYDQTLFRVLSPNTLTPKGSNNHSCVLMLDHSDYKILISGDIEKQVERYLVKTMGDGLAANVLLVPHQGSKTSSTPEFLDAVSPTLAIVAAGYRNHYGHPHNEVVNRYREKNIELASTIESGSVLLKINQLGLSQTHYRKQQQRFWHYQKMPN